MANNTATETGGALYSSAANLFFFSGNHQLVGNQARSGGAVYAIVSAVHICSQSLLVAGNLATDMGGALYISKTSLAFLSGNKLTYVVEHCMVVRVELKSMVKIY